LKTKPPPPPPQRVKFYIEIIIHVILLYCVQILKGTPSCSMGHKIRFKNRFTDPSLEINHILDCHVSFEKKAGFHASNQRSLLSELNLWRRYSTDESSLNKWNSELHCKEILMYVFPEKCLRGLSLNFHIQVSVSDLYIPTIGPPIFLQQNMQTDRGNI
jgi:hypothetical protein